MGMKSNLVIAHIFATELEAETARSALEAAGIAAIIQADTAGGMRPHIGWSGSGFRVLVARKTPVLLTMSWSRQADIHKTPLPAGGGDLTGARTAPAPLEPASRIPAVTLAKNAAWSPSRTEEACGETPVVSASALKHPEREAVPRIAFTKIRQHYSVHLELFRT